MRVYPPIRQLRSCPCPRPAVILAACGKSDTPAGKFHPINSCSSRAHTLRVLRKAPPRATGGLRPRLRDGGAARLLRVPDRHLRCATTRLINCSRMWCSRSTSPSSRSSLEASFSRSSATSAPGDGSMPWGFVWRTWSLSPSSSRRLGSEPPAPSQLSKCGCVRMRVQQPTAAASSSIGCSGFCTIRPPLGSSRLLIRSLVCSSRLHGGTFHQPPGAATIKQMPSRLAAAAIPCADSGRCQQGHCRMDQALSAGPRPVRGRA